MKRNCQQQQKEKNLVEKRKTEKKTEKKMRRATNARLLILFLYLIKSNWRQLFKLPIYNFLYIIFYLNSRSTKININNK